MRELYRHLAEAPLDPIMQATAEWAELQRSHSNPINTTIGVLLDPETGKAWRPYSVNEALLDAQDQICANNDYGYQTQSGNQEFLAGTGGLVFGRELHAQLQSSGNLISMQSQGGTGTLNLAKDVLYGLLEPPHGRQRAQMLADQGWPNHRAVFGDSFTYTPVERTSDPLQNHQLFLNALERAPEGTVCLLQACGYNDDGLDRTGEQWNELFDAMAAKHMVALLDAAYLGLADNIDTDRTAIQQAVEHGLFSVVCVSTSKNMGLYNERLGALYIANAQNHLGQEQARRLEQLAAKVVRRTYSSPPRLAAYAVGIMLGQNSESTPTLRQKYLGELDEARARLHSNRAELAAILGERFTQLSTGKGLFTRLLPEGFSDTQRSILKDEGILALPNSRINIGGIHPRHIERVGQALLRAVEAKS